MKKEKVEISVEFAKNLGIIPRKKPVGFYKNGGVIFLNNIPTDEEIDKFKKRFEPNYRRQTVKVFRSEILANQP
jgi:hypothetical protein